MGSECDGYVIQTKNFRFALQDSAEAEARGRAEVLSDFLEVVKEKLNLSTKIEQSFVNFFSEFGYEVPLLSEERLTSESPRSSVASSSSANLRFLSPQRKENTRDAQHLEVVEENCPKS